MCLGVGLFASILLGTQCASWTCMSISFTKLGKFSFITFQTDFQFLALSLLLLAPLWYKYWTSWSYPRGCLYYPKFSGFFFSSCCSDWLFFASLCSKSLIWFSAPSTLLLFPCKLFFISVSVSFLSDWIFFMLLRSSLSSLRSSS